MTKFTKPALKSIYATVALFFMSIMTTLAQETSKLDVDIDLGGNGPTAGAWYSQTWVWIVGGLVFILLLVALLRGGNSNKA